MRVERIFSFVNSPFTSHILSKSVMSRTLKIRVKNEQKKTPWIRIWQACLHLIHLPFLILSDFLRNETLRFEEARLGNVFSRSLMPPAFWESIYRRADKFWAVPFTVSPWEWVYAKNSPRLERETRERDTSKRHVGKHSLLISAILLPQHLRCYWGKIKSQSYITTDSLSASPSWYQAPTWDPGPIFSHFLFDYFFWQLIFC
jgi:hypothetical protein